MANATTVRMLPPPGGPATNHSVNGVVVQQNADGSFNVPAPSVSDFERAGYTLLNPTSAPATSSSAGVPGQWAYDATHFYVCVATNAWCRATIATF